MTETATGLGRAERFVVHRASDEPVCDLSQAHLWLCDLDDVSLPVQFLSASERIRIMRLKDPQERKRMTGRFAFVRGMIGKLLGISLDGWEFYYDSGGKPQPVCMVGGNGDIRRLHFNVSHSENILVLAVSAEHSLGVDIEVVRPEVDPLEIAKTVFVGANLGWLRELPHSQAVAAFYRLWTRNEALAKLDGSGIATRQHETAGFQSLHSFEFSTGEKDVIGAVALGEGHFLTKENV